MRRDTMATFAALAASLALTAGAMAASKLDSLIVNRFLDNDGKEIVGIKTIPMPKRPAGFPERTVKKFPATAVVITTPAFDWTYGCSATSAGMMFGYYDRNGYSHFYTGPVDEGRCPLTNAAWGAGECPFVASKLGLDGRLDKGHVDDYWYATKSTIDPYLPGGWAEHTPLDCTADFMGTNQYHNWLNEDGGTTFYFHGDGTPLYDCADQDRGRDGCHGMKLFANSCGYTLLANGNFNQYISPNKAAGFTFAQYQAEIDLGRPVLIHVDGHTMLGVGYDAIPKTVYLHDTWDYLTHEMTWGGSYSGLAQYGVTVFRLDPSSGEPQ